MVCSREIADSMKVPFRFLGNITVTNNGISPIPAFALGEPALMVRLSAYKKQFSYDPNMAWSLNGRPWYINNWLHYKFIDKPKFEFRSGINANLYFSPCTTAEVNITKVQRLGMFELAVTYEPSSKGSVGLLFWYSKGFDRGTLSGHLIDLFAIRSFTIGDKLLFNIMSQFFYMDNTGKMDGLLISGKFILSYTKTHISLFTQETQALLSNMEPFPGFTWNVGVSWSY